MSRKIYKYFSSGVLDLVFQRDECCALKCSLPKDYNDPYELFLGVDTTIPSEDLATYRDIIQELPQLPTTCFSRSPIIPPMWAHYAQNHSGFVLEFDLEEIKATLPDAGLSDVSYRDSPNPGLAESVARGAVTKKPRHAVWLRDAVLHEAYFSKYSIWSYEQECRLVVGQDDVEPISNSDILFLPAACVSAILAGSNSSSEFLDKTGQIAQENDLDWYETVIGNALPSPFFRTDTDTPFLFRDGGIQPAENMCEECSEPTDLSDALCSWCRITDAQKYEAAQGNPFRVLDRIGNLQSYLDEVAKIHKRSK